MQISLITYKGLADLDPDDQLLKTALERRGCKVQGLVWDDENVDWENAGVCVLRSTWDYHLSYDKFCSWLFQLSQHTSIMNPVDLVLWNSKKTYLKDLAAAGLPVIPTVFIDENNRQELASLMQSKGWSDIVIKPVVGLATSGVKRIGASKADIEAGEKHISELLKLGEVMVQEFLPSVEGLGERALCFIDGEYSHCVRKSPFQQLAVAGRAGETAVQASDIEIDIAERIVAHLDAPPLYARVDLVGDKNGNPLLLELELVEPSLFLQTNPQAAELFAEAIVSRVSCLNQPG